MIKRRVSWRKLLRYGVPLLLTALWLCFIFGNSLQNGEESGNHSHAVQVWLNEILRWFGFPKPLSEGFVRKLAHFGEFAILAVLYILDGVAFGKVRATPPVKSSFLFLFSSVPVCFLVASVDEFLQRFSAGRAAQFSDMLLDTAGALTGALCCALILLIRKRKARQRES